MEHVRIWHEVDIAEIKEHIVMVDDKYAHCPNCKKIGLEIKGLKKCPSCEREFKYATSKEAAGGKTDIVARTLKKIPGIIFIDYDDYQHATGKQKAASLFKV